MEKKIYRFSTNQNDILNNQKIMKKSKEVKLLNNYIPIKKKQAHSNISEYETEQSIQKNFSNKCKNKQICQKSKSVQTTHNNNSQYSPKDISIQSKTKRNSSKISKSSKGNSYLLNNLNIYDYFSEKVILTQKKFIEAKDNKINTLKKQLNLIKQEISLYERKYNKNKNIVITDVNKKLNNNDKIVPKIIYVNKNNNKNLLVNNNSYMSLHLFSNKELSGNEENADKKLEKYLSDLILENNSDNNLNLINKEKKNYLNKNDNKNNLLNIMYQSKKGCYNHNKNNYIHNGKNMIKNNTNNNRINIKKENLFKNNNVKEKKCENAINRNDNINNFKLEVKYQTLNEKINQLFDCYFDYYNKNNDNQKSKID